MISRLYLSTLLAITAALWSVLLILDGVTVSVAFLKPLSMVLGALLLILGLFDKWAWHLPFLHPWFVSIPDLRGTWKGQIISTWVDPQTGNKISPIDAYFVVRQTFSSLQIRLITTQSSSELLTGNIVRDIDGIYVVLGIYVNTPKLRYRDVSPIHHGGLLLHIQGNPPHTLSGQYWTDRDTKGELHFTERSRKLYYDFEDAEKGSYKKLSDDVVTS